jgi:hypothetical protein
MSNKHCYVIASGPSLIGFDFSALPEGTRIGANRSAWLADCDILCTVDKNFHMKEAERIKQFGSRAYVAIAGPRPTVGPDVNYWAYSQNFEGLALTPSTLSGSNSGFAALNLAVQLGFTEIALLGFDMKWDGDRSHFHEGYGQKRHIERNLAIWAEAFDRAAQQTRERGIHVTNFIGPMGSRVKSYPTAPLQELL